MIEQTLDNELMKIGVNDPLISTVLTYIKVDKNDPAFLNPTKPVGPAFQRKRRGFRKTPKGWRKVVPSPDPVKIIEWREIKILIDHGFIVIACGGGGIPVTKDHRRFEGIEAVIDKDLASAKLGEEIDADVLIIATEVEKVALNFQQPDELLLDSLSVAEAEEYMDEGQFPPGSMGPKIQAAINFVKSGKKRKSIITSLENIELAIDGKTGTHVYT
jgi:carbamate kinase